MQRSLVMTVIGDDRPGLVETVARVVALHGGNWLESRMSRLGGQFAGIVHVEVPEPQETTLISALRGLSSQGLAVAVHADQPNTPSSNPVTVLELIGQDRPGIVQQISEAQTYEIPIVLLTILGRD